MTARKLVPRLIAAVFCLPLAAQVETFTLSIAQTIWGGLGDCGTATTPPGGGACDGSAPIELNMGPGVNPGWPTWGIGLAFDLSRLQALNTTTDSAAPPANGAQGADFAVGATGGGSAGSCCGSRVHPITPLCAGVVNGDTANPCALTQTGTLAIGWNAHTLTIDPADLVINVNAIGTYVVHFSGFTLPPPIAMPELPALPMFAAGLVALPARQRRARTTRHA